MCKFFLENDYVFSLPYYQKQVILIVLIFRMTDVNSVSFSCSMRFPICHKDKLRSTLRCLLCFLYIVCIMGMEHRMWGHQYWKRCVAAYANMLRKMSAFVELKFIKSIKIYFSCRNLYAKIQYYRWMNLILK